MFVRTNLVPIVIGRHCREIFCYPVFVETVCPRRDLETVGVKAVVPPKGEKLEDEVTSL